MTLNAMHPDIIVVRHQDSGASNLLSQKVKCAVLNAGDGRREHPTQALLDALTIIDRKEKIEGKNWGGLLTRSFINVSSVKSGLN